MKIVQFPGGPSEQEQSVIGAERQVRVDTTRGALRVHDGVTQGGLIIPNVDEVRSIVATGGGASSGAAVRYYATEAELKDQVPTPNMIAVVNVVGLEEIYVWRAGANDGGGLSSNVDGYWRRLDSNVGFYVRMYRAGLINMQLEGAEPVANQDITAWLTNNTIKLYDGADYVTATPALFARLLSKIGNYAGLVTFPDQLADLMLEDNDLNTIAVTGWFKSAAADANAPSATPSPVFTYTYDANQAYQIFFTFNDTTRGQYVRTKSAGAWGAWTFVDGALPSRLAATPTAITDADSGVDSGFYSLASTAANLPVAENGTIQTLRRTSTDATQLWRSTANDKIYSRRRVSSVWQAWVQVYPANVTVATGTLPRANVGILTIDQAEAEAGTATTDRIFTALRVSQAITSLIGGALRTLRALTLVAGDLLYATGAGVLTRLAKGTAGQVLTMNAGATAPEWATPASASAGTYTPVLTNVANVSSSSSGVLYYSRVGNYVHVWGNGISMDPGSSAAVQFAISLPIPSNFTSAADLDGTIWYNPAGTDWQPYFAVSADTVNDRALWSFTSPSSAGGSTLIVDFTYEVK